MLTTVTTEATGTEAAVGSSTRGRLTRTSLRLFAERGYDGISNREIVQACGLTKGAIYWYFESKEHLFRSVLTETLAQWRRRLADAAAAADTWQGKLSALCQLYADTLESPDDPHRDLLILLAQRFPAAPRERALGLGVRAQLLDWTVEMLLAGGCPPDRAPRLAALVQAVGLGATVQAGAGLRVTRSVLSTMLQLAAGGDTARRDLVGSAPP